MYTRPTLCSVLFCSFRAFVNANKTMKKTNAAPHIQNISGAGFLPPESVRSPNERAGQLTPRLPFGLQPWRSEKGILFGDKNYRNCTTQVHVNADPRPLIATRLCVYFKDGIGKSTAQLVQLY